MLRSIYPHFEAEDGQIVTQGTVYGSAEDAENAAIFKQVQ